MLYSKGKTIISHTSSLLPIEVARGDATNELNEDTCLDCTTFDMSEKAVPEQNNTTKTWHKHTIIVNKLQSLHYRK